MAFTRFWTESGTEYLIDHDEKIWKRGYNPDSTLVRTDNGVFVHISEIEIGESVTIICPPIVAGSQARIIMTTPVRNFEKE